MSKLGDTLGFGMKGEASAMPSIPEDIDEMDAAVEEPVSEKGGSPEVMAMKLFDSAESPEDRVAAFKTLLEACGGSY